MCGITGYADKTGRQAARLGPLMLRMLTALGRRGPDSAGVAMYTQRPDEAHLLRVKLGEANGHASGRVLDERAAEILRRAGAVGQVLEQERNGEYLRLALGFEGDALQLQQSIEAVDPEIEVLSLGQALDLVKQVGSPQALDTRFGLARMSGTHAIAHTRLSTESRIDLSHSQPFWAHGALDLATVHNGHITNYHKLRRQYEQRGVRFYTENDSEIIGLYLAETMQAGASFDEALRSSIRYFDGSFSYLAATETEIGYAKDPFGLKPLIMTESPEFVAFATEEVALRAVFGPDVDTWEPPAGSSQTWQVRAGEHHQAKVPA